MKNFILLFFIVLTAAFLRFYQLGVVAPSLTWDEVAWGYNAYSLGLDGKDEFGRFLPYDYLESFGDFKPPVYAYLDIFPIKLFGLTEFAVRFPSALFGSLTVLITYFLTKQLFPLKSKSKEPDSNNQNSKNSLEIGNLKLEVPIVAAALLAISPWHIMLSRAAFEANVSTFFIITGVWLFLKGVENKPWLLILSAISFVVTIYTFNTARVVSPLLVLILAIAFWKKIWIFRKQAVVAALVGLFLILPTLSFLFSPQARLRFKEVNIFSNVDIIERTNQEMANDNNAWWSNVLHNRRFAFGAEYVHHYFDNLSPLFLFIKGDGNPKFSIQTVGQMYLFELPFFIAGILFLFRKREKNWWIIPTWLLVAIVPAATARETPHALRIETALPTFQILVAYGLVVIASGAKQSFRYVRGLPRALYALAMTLFVLFAMFNVVYFLENYFNHYPKRFSREWQYGYKDAVLYMNQEDKNYSKVYLTKELGRPYVYTLFYKKYDPALFRKEANIIRDPFGFVTVESFDKYYFERETLITMKAKNVLYIDSPSDVPENANILKRFKALDGSDVMVAYTL